MTKTRIAAIDIGTNSIRCIVAEATREGSHRMMIGLAENRIKKTRKIKKARKRT